MFPHGVLTMFKNKKIIKWVIIITAVIVGVAGIIWSALFSLFAPNKEKIEEYYEHDKDDLIIVADYLSNMKYPFVNIDESNLEDEVIFTGASTQYQPISDENALKSLKKLIDAEDYILIGKDHNTIFFQKWSFLEKDRGIAMSIDKDKSPAVEFIIKSEPLSEAGWYYYEADYEKYRN